MHPRLRAHVLPLHHGRLAQLNMQWNIGTGGGLAARDHLAVLHVLVGLRHRGRWPPSPPSTTTPQRDTPKALRASALFSVAVYALLPLGLGGTLGTEAVADDPTFIAFYTQAFDELVGNALANVMIACIVGGLRAVDEHGDDGRLAGALRHLQGRDDDPSELGVLNRFRVPGPRDDAGRHPEHLPDLATSRASLDDPRGRATSATCSRTCCALSGFLLLRRDRPNWPRPIRLSTSGCRSARAARGGQPRVHRLRAGSSTRAASGSQVRLRLGQDAHRSDRARGRPAALHLPQGRRGPHGRPAARGDARDAAGGDVARPPRRLPA